MTLQTTDLATYTDRHGAVHAFGDRVAEQQVRDDDRVHVFHSWSAQAKLDPLPIAAGRGSTFWDYEGKPYLDFSSQLVNLNLGHQHPDLITVASVRSSPESRTTSVGSWPAGSPVLHRAT
jgi:taurine---2-oxoglutarate transaminase